MLTDAFEEAFYYLDQDRDGVITVPDLERYAAEKNLKDKFIQKWLNLFADEKKIIYYDTFCVTLGIVPAKDRFQYKIHKTDMTESTRKFVIETVSNIKERNKEFSKSSLKEIIYTIEMEKGGKWDIIVNPSINIVDIKYGEDGLLYYNVSTSEDVDILVWRLPDKLNKRPQPKIHKVDMSEKTQKSVMDIIASIQEEKFSLYEARKKIINDIATENGGDWDMRLNPDEKDLDVTYESDGLIYYSPDVSGDMNVLIWRVPRLSKNKECQEIIYECDMSNPVKEGVLKSFYSNYHQEDNKLQNSSILEELNGKFGKTWNIELNPKEDKIRVDYDFEGMIYFSPKSKKHLKVLIWRKDKGKKPGFLCCGCLF